MDNRPIGVYDSGLGGLTAVREIRKLFPRENIIYLGDTGRVPYGTRSFETILRFSREALEFLLAKNPKIIVIACGTVSTVALEYLSAPIPLVGVVEPSVRKAAKVTRNGKIGLIATPASVKSGAYERCLNSVAPDCDMLSRDGRLLVPIVEAGRVGREDPVAKLLVGEYMEPFRTGGVDTLILGCTHYPLLEDVIRDYLGDGVTLINAGAAAAAVLGGLTERGGNGESGYYITDSAVGFEQNARLFLGEEFSGIVEKVYLE